MTAITVCVPVYNGAEFVGETLEHILAQTFRDFRIAVSVDPGDDASLAVCRRFTADTRCEVIAQPTRLGWVANTNALIDRVDTPFFCITPHDDLLDPRYLEAMHHVLASEPTSACAFSDLLAFGKHESVIEQPDVLGGRSERVLDVILNHYCAPAFRGLIRRRSAHDRPHLPSGLPHDFAADTAWLVRLAQRGELRRVPELLYRKRYHDTSVHAAWARWSRTEQLRLGASLVASFARLALEESHDAFERDEVLSAALLRASGHTTCAGLGIPTTPLEIALAVAELASVGRDLEPWPDVSAVLARTRSTVLRHATRAPEAVDGPRPLIERALRKAIRLLAR